MPKDFCENCGGIHEPGNTAKCEANQKAEKPNTRSKKKGNKMATADLEASAKDTSEMSLLERRERVAKEVKALLIEDELADLEEQRNKLLLKREKRQSAASRKKQDGADAIVEATGATDGDESEIGASQPYVDAAFVGSSEDGFCNYGMDVGRSRPSTRRRRTSSSSSTSRSASRRRRSKWNLKRFTVGKRDVGKLNCYELLAATGKWALGIKEMGVKDYRVLLEHMVFLALRARTNEYFDSAHTDYDLSIRTLAEEIGFAAFSSANRGSSVLFYSALQIKGRKSGSGSYHSGRASSNTKRPCYAWNSDQGCSRGEDACRFAHVCAKCNGKGHKRQTCKE